MLLGFMSLTLAVTQRSISKICIPTHVANTMLPCRRALSTNTTKTTRHLGLLASENSSFDSWISEDQSALPAVRRLTSSETFGTADHCSPRVRDSGRKVLFTFDSTADYTEVVFRWIFQGMTALISVEGVNQLSIFIFVLAAMQIVYSVLTMALGRAKVMFQIIRQYKMWFIHGCAYFCLIPLVLYFSNFSSSPQISWKRTLFVFRPV